MKTYNSSNFFKHTFCEFHQVDDFDFPKDKTYKSDSDSEYYYTKEGVYRKSNHWGRVANCRWKLISNGNYKNQQTVIAFAKWSYFFPINSLEKIYYISVDFEKQSVKIKPKKETINHFLFTYSEAVKRKKQIYHLFKNDKWASFYELSLDYLIKKVIEELINTNKSLNEIKQSFRKG